MSKDKSIVEKIVSDLVPVISADLQISIMEADALIRETQFYKVLTTECILNGGYDINGLKLVLRKELIRSGKYPLSEDGEIRDCSDFVKTMIHEIVYDNASAVGCKLTLTQVSLIVEGIPSLTTDDKDVQIIKNLRDKCLKQIP